MKVFLDDIRDPRDCLGYMHTRIGPYNDLYSQDWAVVRNYDEFRGIIMHYADKITHVSFDHDLSDEHYNPVMMVADEDYNQLYDTFKEFTGKECAEWMKEFYNEIGRKLPMIFVHSMNPVGRQNILNVFS